MIKKPEQIIIERVAKAHKLPYRDVYRAYRHLFKTVKRVFKQSSAHKEDTLKTIRIKHIGTFVPDRNVINAIKKNAATKQLHRPS